MSIIKLESFVAGSYQSRSKSIDLQETVNLYPEKQNPTSKSNTSFIGTPGLSLYTAVNPNGNFLTTPPRGFYTTGTGRIFYVNSHYLIELLSGGLFIVRSNGLTIGSNYVSMCDNGISLLLVDGTSGYIFSLVNKTLQQITDPVFPSNPTSCCYRDGYFIVNQGKTNNFYLSAQGGDGMVWTDANGLPQVASKESDSDPIIAVITTPTYLWLFGRRTVELWYSTGQPVENSTTAVTFPFQRSDSYTLSTGTISANSIVVNGDEVFWMGSNPSGNDVVWRTNSFSPTRISTHAIEFLIEQLIMTTDVSCWGYQQEGHFFYVMNFPTGRKTYVYDLTTNQWHERNFWNISNGTRESHLGLFAATNGNDIYVCDRRNGNIYTMSLDIYTDNGALIERIRTTSHFDKNMNNLYFFKVELDLQKGVGVNDPS